MPAAGRSAAPARSTGSYTAAFANGLAWNALNITVILLLLMRARAHSVKAGAGFAT